MSFHVIQPLFAGLGGVCSVIVAVFGYVHMYLFHVPSYEEIEVTCCFYLNRFYFATITLLNFIGGYTVIKIQSTRYLEVQGILWITLKYSYIDISDLQNWEKNNKSNNHISQMNIIFNSG